jgi:hypothetical protein
MKTLKYIAVAVLIVLLLLSLPVALLLFSPSALINNRTLALLPGLLQSRNLLLSYDKADINVYSFSFREKRIDIKLLNACLRQDHKFAVCFADLKASVVLDFLGDPVVVKTIGPISLTDGLMKFWQRDKQEEETSNGEFNLTSLRQHIVHTDIQPLSVADLKLFIETETQEKAAIIRAVSNVVDKNTLDLQAHVDGIKNWPLDSLDLVSILKHEENEVVKVTVKAQGKLPRKKTNFTAGLEGQFSPEAITATLKGTFANISEGLDLVQTPGCSISAKAVRQNLADITIQNCPFLVQRNFFEGERNFPVAPPRRVTGRVDGSYRVAEDKFNFIRGRTDVALDPLKTTLFSLSGKAHIDMHGQILSRVKRSITLSVDSQVSVPKFERVVRRLRDTSWSVPAPLNTLSGDLGCHIYGSVDLNKGTSRVPYQCSTDLSGADQRFLVRGNGTLSLLWLPQGIKPHIESDIQLQNVTVILPTIELQKGLPSLRSDPRFISESVEEYRIKQSIGQTSRRFPFSYRIRIRTMGNPLRVKAPSFKTVIPGYLDLVAEKDAGLSGFVKIQRFDVKIVNKKVTIDHANFVLAPRGNTQIDTVASVEKSDMTLILNIIGTTKKPEVIMTSDPPRPQQELVSNMLYGNDTGSLDTNQQRTVGETRAALADGAIGLISMLYLASTPVESVGYNPHSKEFHAEVRVQKGTSLKIGSDFETNQTVGLSRALGGNWSFETSAVSEKGESTTRGIAMLRWARRY